MEPDGNVDLKGDGVQELKCVLSKKTKTFRKMIGELQGRVFRK